jgi:hypothetical protein
MSIICGFTACLLFFLGAFHAYGDYFNVLERLLETQAFRQHGYVADWFSAFLASYWFGFGHLLSTEACFFRLNNLAFRGL